MGVVVKTVDAGVVIVVPGTVTVGMQGSAGMNRNANRNASTIINLMTNDLRESKFSFIFVQMYNRNVPNYF
jgi:hypothetical protein